VVKPVPGVLLFPRLNPFDVVTDVAVPLQTVADALNRKPDGNLNSTDETQLATDLVLGFPCPVLFACNGRTQVEQAIAAHPTALIVDIGNNDILGPVTSGQLASILSSPAAQAAFFAQFHQNYVALLQQLSTTGAPMIIGNLPDVIETAYFIPVPKLAAAFHAPPNEVATLLGVSEADYITLDALSTVDAILTNQMPGPLPPKCGIAPCVVTAGEAQAARQAVAALNQDIGVTAAAFHATVVDLFSLINSLYANGYKVGGVTLTGDYLGGLFSLDGIHPTNSGYAIMANAFIKAIDAVFSARIPQANVELVALFDPLVLKKPRHR
jgi:lysophospholipase L1-like esterase